MQEASRFQTRLQSSRISSAVAYLSCSTNPNPIECLEVEFRTHHEPRRGFNQSWIPRPGAIASEFNAFHQDSRDSLQRRRLRRSEIHEGLSGKCSTNRFTWNFNSDATFLHCAGELRPVATHGECAKDRATYAVQP